MHGHAKIHESFNKSERKEKRERERDVGSMVCRTNGNCKTRCVLDYRNVGMLRRWNRGMSDCRYVGLLQLFSLEFRTITAPRNRDTSDCRCVGLSGCRTIGASPYSVTSLSRKMTAEIGGLPVCNARTLNNKIFDAKETDAVSHLTFWITAK